MHTSLSGYGFYLTRPSDIDLHYGEADPPTPTDAKELAVRRIAIAILICFLPMLASCAKGQAETSAAPAASVAPSNPASAGDLTSNPPVSEWKGTISLNSGTVPPPHSWSKTLTIQGTKFVISEKSFEGDKEKEVSKTKTATDKEMAMMEDQLDKLALTQKTKPKIGGETANVDVTNGNKGYTVMASSDDPRFESIKALFTQLTEGAQ